MAYLDKSNNNNFLTWQKIMGNMTLGELQQYGLPLAFDEDAQAFIDELDTLTLAEQTAIDDLVRGLKYYGLWDKMIAIYPMIGGAYLTHRYNLKDPRLLDAAFRISFTGGWTHSSTGATPNGTTSYGNTHIIPNDDLTDNSASLGYYSRTNSAFTDEYVMGVSDQGGISTLSLIARRDTDLGGFWAEGSSVAYRNAKNLSITNGQGFFQGSQSGSVAGFRRNTLITFNTDVGLNQGANTHDLFIGCWNNYTAGTDLAESFTDKECAFAYVGNTLSTEESRDYYDIVQRYQIALNRDV